MSTTIETKGAPRAGSGEMFDLIAHRYDLLNRILSLGMDQGWRRRTVRELRLGPGARVLDLATGTGDLALQIARTHADVTVVGLDPSREMLARAEEKGRAADLGGRVGFVLGDAQELPLEDASFDAVCMAFGIRNVPDRPRALAEIARVTRRGGRVGILELGEPRRGVMGALARFHVHVVVPRVGAALSGADEYAYLQRSIAAFPPAEEFGAIMEASGLRVIAIVPFVFGAANLYVAEPARAEGP
jgi:demethylmenaquinone methyltransferase/2-methoxy-6-polyprenyl-1,4-benzoquinol methylase